GSPPAVGIVSSLALRSSSSTAMPPPLGRCVVHLLEASGAATPVASRRRHEPPLPRAPLPPGVELDDTRGAEMDDHPGAGRPPRDDRDEVVHPHGLESLDLVVRDLAQERRIDPPAELFPETVEHDRLGISVRSRPPHPASR